MRYRIHYDRRPRCYTPRSCTADICSTLSYLAQLRETLASWCPLLLLSTMVDGMWFCSKSHTKHVSLEKKRNMVIRSWYSNRRPHVSPGLAGSETRDQDRQEKAAYIRLDYTERTSGAWSLSSSSDDLARMRYTCRNPSKQSGSFPPSPKRLERCRVVKYQ